MYKVYDTCGQFLAAFPTFKAATEYKISMGRYDWIIRSPIGYKIYSTQIKA